MKTKVAYQGEEGSYSSIAAEYLVPGADLSGYDSFEGVFAGVQSGEASLAVLPFENTLIGSIYEVYDLLFEHDGFEIVGEVGLRIDHNLLGIQRSKNKNQRSEVRYQKSDDRLAQIKQVYSHPKALEQCRKFFREHPWIEPVVADDTAGAAAALAARNKKQVSSNKQSSIRQITNNAGGQAVIASMKAAKIYGLEIVKGRIQDNKENYTRFVVVKRGIYQEEVKLNGEGKSAIGKTSLVFAAAHKPGSLLKCMEPFAAAHLNLTKIESRPLIGQPWKYLFYLDFEHPSTSSGQATDKSGAVEKVLSEMQPHTMILRKLGTYKKGVVVAEGDGGVVAVD